MRRFLIVVMLLGSTTLPALAEKRVALVMAADRYKTIRPLDNAVNDAQTIEASLEKLGFEVILETDRDLRRMRRALEDFREDAAGADVALVYFAGHGVEIQGENRLLPTDADATSVDTLKETSLPLEEVRETVSAVSKVGLILLDACRNDPFAGGVDGGRGAKALTVRDPAEVKPGLGRLGKAENLLYTFSAAPGATAADGTDGNSPFTAGLAKYLGTDGLEIRSVLTLVQQEVYDRSRGKQLPYVENGLPKLFFASSSAGALPERERLLLAMADVTPDLRDEVERIAREKDMPLAPLYGALIGSTAGTLSADDRRRKLDEAATAYVAVRTQMKTLASTDPAVAALRQEAETQLELGAFDTARGKLTEAASIDSSSREALKANFLDRTLSEATTHVISGGASRSDLNYDLAIASYRKAASLYDDVTREKLSDEQREQQLATLDTLGALYVTVGDLTEARKAFEIGKTVATALTEAEPDKSAWRGSLATSMLNVGDIQRDQGDSKGALVSYQQALDLRKAVAAASSGDAAARGLQADAELKIGALHRLQGDIDAALVSYEAGRDIADGLVRSNAGGDRWLGVLARSQRLIGEIEQQQNKFDDARASFEASLDAAKRLADAKPHDPLRQFDLASAYDAMGSIQYGQLQNDRTKYSETGAEGALASYEAAAAITKRLIAADAKNTTLQRGLAGTLEKIGEATYFGDSLITKDDADRSLAAYTSANTIREKLVQADPANKTWVADLVTSYEKIATWYEFVPDDETAISYSKKAHEAVLKLAALDPANIQWQRNATLYHAKLAGSYVQLKDNAAALAYDEAGLAYARKVAEANPDKQVYQSDVIVFHQRVAFDKRKLNDYPGYFAQNDLRLEAAKASAATFPEDPNSQRDLYSAYLDVGETYTKNFPNDALALFDAARKSAEKAASLDPSNPDYIYGVYNAQLKSAYVLEGRGDRQAALAAYSDSLQTIERAVALKPDDVAYTASRDHVLARMGDMREAGGAQ